MKTKRKQPSHLSKIKDNGKVGLLFIFGVTVGFFAYFVISHSLPKDQSSSFQPEPESFAAGKNTTLSNAITVEAENMSYLSVPDGIQDVSDVDASGGRGKIMALNNNIVTSVNISSPASKLTLRAKGINCQGWPNATVSLNGVNVLDKKISASQWHDFSERVSLQPGTYNVTIMFANDYSNQRCDRNLTIDKLVFQ
jgi:hypothetical protein